MHALLLLADGRLPTGSHAHSGGLEQAVAGGLVGDADTLGAFLSGRLVTAGRVDAAFAVLAWADATRGRPRWAVLDAELAARIPSPAARRASRAQGRGLLRAARRCWPAPLLDGLTADLPDGPLWAVALGAAGVASGLDAGQVAAVAASSSVSGPGWAATRLLGLDPFAVAQVLAELGPLVEREAATAGQWAAVGVDPADLPATGAPLLDIGAETHATWEVRLFAS